MLPLESRGRRRSDARQAFLHRQQHHPLTGHHQPARAHRSRRPGVAGCCLVRSTGAVRCRAVVKRECARRSSPPHMLIAPSCCVQPKLDAQTHGQGKCASCCNQCASSATGVTPRQASKGALHHWCRPERKFCSDDSPKHPVLCMQASLDRHATLLAAPAGQLAGAAADCCFKPTGCTAAAIHNRPVQVKPAPVVSPKLLISHHTVPWFVQHLSSSEPTLHTQCSLKHGQACAVLPPTRQAASPEPRAFTLLFDGRRGLPDRAWHPAQRCQASHRVLRSAL